MLKTENLGGKIKLFKKQLTEWQDSVIDLANALVTLWDSGEKYGKDHIIKKKHRENRWAIFKHEKYMNSSDEEVLV